MRKAFYKGKLIAQIDDNSRQIIKNVDRKRHFFRVYNAWAIDKNFLDSEDKDYDILLNEKSGKVYKAKVGEVREYDFVKSFGYGDQYFYPESKWEEVKKSEDEQAKEDCKKYNL